MNLVFATEARFIRNFSGDIYSIDGSYSNQLWDRYLKSFNKIFVVARVRFDPEFSNKNKYLANGKKVHFIELPYFIGPVNFIRNRNKIKNVLKNKLPLTDCAYLCRVPGTIGTLVINLLKKNKKHYGLEVVGDPWDVFSIGSIRHPLRPFLKWYGYINLVKIVKSASAILYVTKFTLQNRYPANPVAYTTYASNVRIDNSQISNSFKTWKPKSSYKIISVGSLAQMYKSPDVVLKAIRQLHDEGIGCELIWLGDGNFKSDMIKLAKQLKISDKVSFLGNLSGEQVMNYLKKSDIFILASRTEGLPRAMIEAMASGLPCIGTRVGGIPELLDNQVLVKPGSSNQLANMIKKIITDKVFYNSQAKTNLKTSENYVETVLDARRLKFYEEIRRISKN